MFSDESLRATQYLSDEANLKRLNEILELLNSVLLIAQGGLSRDGIEDSKLHELNRKLGQLVLSFMASNPSLFTPFEHGCLIGIVNRPQPGTREVASYGASLFVSIAARIGSRDYPVMSLQPHTLKRVFLKELVDSLCDFMQIADLASAVRLHSLVLGFITSIPRINSAGFTELVALTEEVNKYCNARVRCILESTSFDFRPISEFIISARHILAACGSDPSTGN
jgi:hypothetical protein